MEQKFLDEFDGDISRQSTDDSIAELAKRVISDKGVVVIKVKGSWAIRIVRGSYSSECDRSLRNVGLFSGLQVGDESGTAVLCRRSEWQKKLDSLK